MFSHAFMRNAYLAGTFIALAAGLIGYFLVLRNQVFAGDALSHVAFTGALAAVVAGASATAGVFVSTIAVSLGLAALGRRGRGRDVVIGTVYSWILGLGALLLAVYTASNSASNARIGVTVLFGSIYGLTHFQAVVAAAVGIGTSLVACAIARPLLFSSLDEGVASARGVPVRALGGIFLVLAGITVAEAVQAVGALLILGLMVTPAATAQLLTVRPFRALALAAGLSVADLWAGLALSYSIDRVPPSFAIIGLAFATYVIVLATARLRRRRAFA
jgi:zinc/manganese transport system permease protein